MSVYGKDFAPLYNKQWAFWGPKMWPFLSKVVARRKPEARTWLDLCCGAGSLLRLVCQHGFEAVGLDLSPHQLKYARKNAPRARLVRADVRSFSLQRKFDVITCLFDSLNYLTKKGDLARAFRNARRHLSDRGLFVFDMNTLEGLRRGWRYTSVLRARGCVLINAGSFDEKRKRGRAHFTGFLKAGRLYRKFEEEHIERGYTPEEIGELLKRVGFAFTRYDGRKFGRPRKRSGRLVYVCRRA